MRKRNTNWLVRATLVVLLIGAAAAISSCATSGFMGFGDPLTTTSYVENAMSDSSTRIAQAEADNKALKAEIAELGNLKAELEDVLDVIEQNRKDTEALQSLATSVNDRLEEMPVEMLRQLVTALQSYLEAVETE
ncbi:MAG: hypothetical protein HN368_16275 [Spirochaetales bacterium]|nr:hypothetical protein [Spirochaetales bacterium]